MSFSENTSDSDWKDAKIKEKGKVKTGCGKLKYSQKFCEKWLSLFEPWLTRSADDPNKPFCRACQCRLDCNRCHLVRHERTTKHKRNLESLVTKGEGAVRKELSVRQERSKYYHQRKRALKEVKQEPVSTVQENDLLEVEPIAEITPNGVIEESTHNFEVIEEAPQEQLQVTPIVNAQAALMTAKSAKPEPPIIKSVPSRNANSSSNKEGLKLLMQIQQDKNELMESFRELIGVQLPHPPLREKNHVDLFFESVSSSVKALSPKLIAEAKMRVSQLICELELRGLRDNDEQGEPTGIEMPITPMANNGHHMAQETNGDQRIANCFRSMT
ncbi:PREDICTED: protein suppressor of variegation 3-7 [Drosophila arizonae]|uniref:Protein suppressor of variegation 3-7 n=1 Tax=Drosophila arizonae TaxID=7263 RepID=A0ABM1P3V3_DROAR|nr:PREDICTED: protein suppressor of variegation 3-7 [Drosophila arizonae]